MTLAAWVYILKLWDKQGPTLSQCCSTHSPRSQRMWWVQGLPRPAQAEPDSPPLAQEARERVSPGWVQAAAAVTRTARSEGRTCPWPCTRSLPQRRGSRGCPFARRSGGSGIPPRTSGRTAAVNVGVVARDDGHRGRRRGTRLGRCGPRGRRRCRRRCRRRTFRIWPPRRHRVKLGEFLEPRGVVLNLVTRGARAVEGHRIPRAALDRGSIYAVRQQLGAAARDALILRVTIVAEVRRCDLHVGQVRSALRGLLVAPSSSAHVGLEIVRAQIAQPPDIARSVNGIFCAHAAVDRSWVVALTALT